MKNGIRQTNTHVYFWNGEFSNWHPWKFKYEGQNFENSEQAFMWMKAKFFGDEEIAKEILKTPNPRENKLLGRKVKNFDPKVWTKVSFDIMVEVNTEKWRVNPRQLIDTGTRTLVEASPVDLIWGVGLAPNDPAIENTRNWRGQNLLGLALMKVRNKFTQWDQSI